MKIIKNDLGFYTINPDKFGDSRGYFSPYYIKENMDKEGIPTAVNELNRIPLKENFAYDFDVEDTCLVEVLEGRGMCLISDPNTKGSETYVILNEREGNQALIPAGLNKKFVSFTKDTVIQVLQRSKTVKNTDIPRIKSTGLEDCYEIYPQKFLDGKVNVYNQSIFGEDGLPFDKVVQCNRSMSSKGTIRGLHYQLDPFCQAKIVEVIQGKAIDVVVDCRTNSSSFGKYTSVVLDPKQANQLFVPRGYAHGFIALEDNTVFQYLVDNKYAPKYEDGITWDDAELGIPWAEMFEEYGITEPLLSEKDLKHDTLSLKLKKNEIQFRK